MEHYLGLAIIAFCVSIAVWIAIEIYRAKIALEQERIRRKLLEYEIREIKKRADINNEPLDELVKRRNRGEGGNDL